MRNAALATALLLVPLLGTAADALAQSSARSCLRIERVTAFAPRGEIYVEVRASCTAEDFDREDPVQAYLEVLVSDKPPVGDYARVYRSEATRAMTFEFRNLSFERGDAILVRLVNAGEILGLQTIKAP